MYRWFSGAAVSGGGYPGSRGGGRLDYDGDNQRPAQRESLPLSLSPRQFDGAVERPERSCPDRSSGTDPAAFGRPDLAEVIRSLVKETPELAERVAWIARIKGVAGVTAIV